MNPYEEHPILVAVATTISDGMPVDWDSLAAEHPEIADDLAALRVLQQMQAVRRDVTGKKPPGGA